MPKQLWDKESDKIYWGLVKEYQEEGYTKQESRKLAKKEMKDIVQDKKDFANNLYKQALNNLD
jgi:pyruvoyl-dependent arginine decarboxylase (PvlArgDC)